MATNEDEMEELFGSEGDEEEGAGAQPDNDAVGATPEEHNQVATAPEDSDAPQGEAVTTSYTEEEILDQKPSRDDNQDPNAEIRDLFGEDDPEDGDGGVDDADGDVDDQQPPMDTSVSKQEPHWEDDEDNRPPVVPKTIREKLCIPTIPRPPPHASICYLKIPKMIGICPHEFDPSSHDETADSLTFQNAASIVRWRYKRNDSGEIVFDAHGRPLRESNAQLVRFTDGSTRLRIGDDEFNVKFQPMRNTYLYAAARSAAPFKASSVGLSQDLDFGKTQEIESHPWRDDPSVLHGMCLEAHGQVTQSVQMEPLGLHTSQHRRFTRRAQTVATGLLTKTQRLKTSAVIRIEKDSDVLDQKFETEYRKARREKIKSSRVARAPRIESSYLEEGQDDGMYRKKPRGRKPRIEDDMSDFIDPDEEDEDDGDGDYGDEDEDEEEEGDAEEEEEEEEEVAPTRKRGHPPTQKEEESGEEAAPEPPVRSKRHRVIQDDDDD